MEQDTYILSRKSPEKEKEKSRKKCLTFRNGFARITERLRERHTAPGFGCQDLKKDLKNLKKVLDKLKSE